MSLLYLTAPVSPPAGSAYEAALRKQHSSMNPRTGWAALDRKRPAKRSGGYGGDDSDAEEQEEGLEIEGMMQSAGGLLASRSGRLQPGTIETTRLKDANQHEPSNAVVQVVEFHPSGQMVMTAGLDKKIRLFQVGRVDQRLRWDAMNVVGCDGFKQDIMW